MTCFPLNFCNPCHSRNFLSSSVQNGEEESCLPFQEHCPHPAHWCFNGSSLCSILAVTGYFIPFIKFQAPICACAACIATQTGSCIAPIKTLSDATKKLASEVEKLSKEILGLQEVSEDIEKVNEKFKGITNEIKLSSDRLQNLMRQLEGYYVDFSQASNAFHALSQQAYNLQSANQALLQTLGDLQDFKDHNDVLKTLKNLQKYLKKSKASKAIESEAEDKGFQDIKSIYTEITRLSNILTIPNTQSITSYERLPSERDLETLDEELKRRNELITILQGEIQQQKISIKDLTDTVEELKQIIISDDNKRKDS